LAWLALVGAGACGPGQSSVPDAGAALRPNLVLVSIDTLRADHVGSYGYFRDTTPRIDALAEQSIVFDRAYAVMSMTLPSHTSLFTSRWPLEHGILGNLRDGGRLYAWSRDLVTFTEVLSGEGYRTAGFISAAPLKRATGFGAGFDVWDEPAERERPGAETVGRAVDWLAGAQAPFFLFVHLYDPHWPQLPQPPFDTMFSGGAELDRWVQERDLPDSLARAHSGKSFDTRDTLNRYCGEVRYADAQVGVLLEHLDALGLADTSIVVVTSDHGDGLNQHGVPGHDGHVWEEQLRVPLVVHLPPPLAAGLPSHYPGLVSLVDLVPTLVGRVPAWHTPGVEAFLAQASGVDVFAAGAHRDALLAQRTPHDEPGDPGARFALTTERWKLIDEPGGPDRLFDRGSDPYELRDAAADEAEVRERLRAELVEQIRRQTGRGAALAGAEAASGDEALLRQLAELGYVGGG